MPSYFLVAGSSAPRAQGHGEAPRPDWGPCRRCDNIAGNVRGLKSDPGQSGLRRRGLTTPLLSLAGCALLFFSQEGTASAQSDRAAAAEVLFQEGTDLRRSGQFSEACAKFEESHRLDPAAGTLLNLGDCRETEGKLATAWALFEEARKTASTAVVRDEARVRATAVKSRLSYLQIDVPASVPGEVIRYGDVILGQPAYGTRVPVDPGELVVSATAPGYVGWKTKIIVKDENVMVHVPGLKKVPEPAAADAPIGRPVGPWILGATGLAALGVGATFGFLAKSHYDSAEGLCPSHTNCGPDAMSEWNQADAFGTASTVLVPLGALALSGGVLWWMMSDPGKANVAQAPQVFVSPSGGFVSYRGAF